MAAELGNQSLGAYVISMAKRTSDVLAVELLQREALLTVGGSRFSSKSAGRHTVSPTAAAANVGASVHGQVSAPFLVPASVHSAKTVNLQANGNGNGNGNGSSSASSAPSGGCPLPWQP